MCQDPTYCVCPQYFHSPSTSLDGSITSFQSPSISSIQPYRYPPWASPQPLHHQNHLNAVQSSSPSHFAPIIPTPPFQPYFRFENTYQQTFDGQFRSPLGNATGTEVNGGEPNARKRKSGSASSKQMSKKRKTVKATTAPVPDPEEIFGVGPSIPISNADGNSNTDAPRYGSLVTERESSEKSNTVASDVWYFTKALDTDEAPRTRPPPNTTFQKTRPKSTYLGCRMCV